MNIVPFARLDVHLHDIVFKFHDVANKLPVCRTSGFIASVYSVLCLF